MHNEVPPCKNCLVIASCLARISNCKHLIENYDSNYKANGIGPSLRNPTKYTSYIYNTSKKTLIALLLYNLIDNCDLIKQYCIHSFSFDFRHTEKGTVNLNAIEIQNILNMFLNKY